MIFIKSIPYFLFLANFLFCPFVSVYSQSAKLTREQYINKYKNIAIQEMKRSGIPASITMAQACLESGDGNSYLATKANNHFGIKCHNWKGKKVYFDDDAKNECFRKYANATESFQDHSDFLTRNARYAFLFDYNIRDYKAWAKGLKKAGYATNPDYPQILIKIIEDYKLYELDKGKIKETSNDSKDIEDIEVSINREVYQNNGVNYIVAKDGDTYETIAKEMEMMPWEIFRYNDLPKTASIKSGQKIYIQPKKKKASRGNNYHIMSDEETMYTLSQRYAIKLKKLYKLNLMEPGELPQPGQKIHLRKKKKTPQEEIIPENKNIELYID